LLYCKTEVLLRRIANLSRKKYTKIRTKSILQKLVESQDLIADITFVKDFTIDSSEISQRASEKRILNITNFR
jgi:RNase adaptor protein for sRNA GlmZ degradation